MKAFVDSSALVTLYVDEHDYKSVRALGPMAVSSLARVEVPAALWLKSRVGDLEIVHAAALVDAFEADFFGNDEHPSRFGIVELNGRLLDQATDMVALYGLKAYDAIQLASALEVRKVDERFDIFVCFDRQLNQAARLSGLKLIPG